jgi:mycobactin lysine-N-oxygenase
MASELLIIGAGPKAMAISAKATALNCNEYSVPDITIFEKNSCGGNWTGNNGYTDGSLRIGTPPDKDVGYPYPKGFSQEVTKHMAANFSWKSFLRSGEAEMRLSEWVDRGRPHPTHNMWASYLRWVNSNTYPSLINAEVEKIKVVNNEEPKWRLEYTDEDEERIKKDGDALVITGPGKPREIQPKIDHPRLFDGKNYWENRDVFKSISNNKSASIGVIGGGETAASIIVDLINTFENTPPSILVFNTRGTIFSRGEGYFENRLFSDPDKEGWTSLTLSDRKEIIERADRSVFSNDALNTIDKATNVYHISAKITDVEIENRYATEKRYLLGEYGNSQESMKFRVDYIINATGFNPWSFLELFDEEIRKELSSKQEKEDAKKEIDRDLSIPSKFLQKKSSGTKPSLHAPMLAGLAQGPGFPNLSCLGRVADRILNEYVKKPDTVAERTLSEA